MFLSSSSDVTVFFNDIETSDVMEVPKDTSEKHASSHVRIVNAILFILLVTNGGSISSSNFAGFQFKVTFGSL